MTNSPIASFVSPQTRPSAARRLGRSLFAAAVWLAVAAGLGLYVYPDRPALVWFLLALCWACYRLRMRAVALFGKADTTPTRR